MALATALEPLVGSRAETARSEVVHQPGNPIDRRCTAIARRLATRTPWLHGPARSYTATVFVHFGCWLALGWWRAWRSGADHRVRDMAAVTTGTTVAFATAQAVSLGLHRHRPAGDTALVEHRADSSFPSDHATVAAAIASGLWSVDPVLGRPAALAAALLAADRVYLGVHHATDVLAGAALGIATMQATVAAARRSDGCAASSKGSPRLAPQYQKRSFR